MVVLPPPEEPPRPQERWSEVAVLNIALREAHLQGLHRLIMEPQQIEYAVKRGVSESDCCAQCNKNLVGSIKPYVRHLIVCAGSASNWMPVIASQPPGDKVGPFRLTVIH